MNCNKMILPVILGGAFAMGSSPVMGQSFGVEYTAEWQTDFRGGYDFLNLLRLSAQIPVCSSVTLEAATLSVAKTGGEPLVDDLLTYSNIEAGNIPLTIARLGVGVTVGSAELFAGISNVNEDYFTSPLTSLFTNSSCGISPTISCNFDIANYPLASWCLHYRQPFGAFAAQTSLYPGQGYYRLAGHDNIFTMRPGRDGFFSISSIDYQRNGIYCILGVALHYGHPLAEDCGEPLPQAAAPAKRFSAAPWFLGEARLPGRLGLHIHGSWASVSDGCRGYAGAGLAWLGDRFQPAIAANYARFSDASEAAVELTCLVKLSSLVSLQPAFHAIGSNGSLRTVGALRFLLAI